MRGDDATEVLASALCLAPRRVANSLGPAAPLAFSPAAFYPSVCKAVVHATARCLGASLFSTKERGWCDLEIERTVASRRRGLTVAGTRRDLWQSRDSI